MASYTPRALTSRLLVGLALLLAMASQAQASRWYQVELLVFRQPGGDHAEHWPAIPSLSYPERARFLVDPQRTERNRRQYPGSQLDQYGRLVSGSSTGASEAPPGSLPGPFVTLPREQLELRGKAAYMERNGGYRILFHETWVQTVAGKKGALPIVLDFSGDGGQWPALQGSVKIYLSRYLHLETNLWLNTDGSYLPGTWTMPAPPLAPPALLVDGANASARPVTTRTSSTASANTVAAQALPGTQSAGPVYPYRHAVLLRQHRRMRSNEIHYIDHPMLGVIAKISPLPEDELSALSH